MTFFGMPGGKAGGFLENQKGIRRNDGVQQGKIIYEGEGTCLLGKTFPPVRAVDVTFGVGDLHPDC